jgi:hypothetical protein
MRVRIDEPRHQYSTPAVDLARGLEPGPQLSERPDTGYTIALDRNRDIGEDACIAELLSAASASGTRARHDLRRIGKYEWIRQFRSLFPELGSDPI